MPGRVASAALRLSSLLLTLPILSAFAVPSPSPWERIVLIGASVSAGFTESEPLGGTQTPRYCLSRYVNAAVAVPHQPALNLASTLFFLRPEAEGKRQIELARQARPTLVLGLDFLFWFCYGEGRTGTERLQRFEQGLKLLETLECPVVVGDLPDASSSINRMLSPAQIPDAGTLAAANRRLKAWAARRPGCAILPLAAFMRSVLANRAVTVHGQLLPAGATRALLQEDKLHPSPSGAAFLAVALLDSVQSAARLRLEQDIHWDYTQVLRLGSLPSARAATP
jgi:hypothetical protein